MITIQYNGNKKTFKYALSIEDLLQEMGIPCKEAKGIAVSINYSVISHHQWTDQLIKDGDQIDVLQAIQGG